MTWAGCVCLSVIREGSKKKIRRAGLWKAGVEPDRKKKNWSSRQMFHRCWASVTSVSQLSTFVPSPVASIEFAAVPQTSGKQVDFARLWRAGVETDRRQTGWAIEAMGLGCRSVNGKVRSSQLAAHHAATGSGRKVPHFAPSPSQQRGETSDVLLKPAGAQAF